MLSPNYSQSNQDDQDPQARANALKTRLDVRIGNGANKHKSISKLASLFTDQCASFVYLVIHSFKLRFRGK